MHDHQVNLIGRRKCRDAAWLTGSFSGPEKPPPQALAIPRRAAAIARGQAIAAGCARMLMSAEKAGQTGINDRT
ncbi:hypothetical protein DC366_13915 [Pelagivirga sediminicola]|uniref:Uncharacterized protein n=2 Tax=Pelagivirga sediminicola TaxID=2170575 RepID=A0A2T7G4X9_9RHOB|nr:hypothetical protein DC366_13915 [Pelagivirga sediminicola]